MMYNSKLMLNGFEMKNKYTTQTCVFDLPTRTILPKRVFLKDYKVGFLSMGQFSEPVYVHSFEQVGCNRVLRLLCKQGMFEMFTPLVGQVCSFRLLDSVLTDFELRAVSLHELFHIELVLRKV